MTIKLTCLSLSELKALRLKVDAAIQKLEKTNLSKARVEAAKLAKEYGIPLESLIADGLAKKPKSNKKVKPKRTVPPKYRHPKDSSLTWTGRGLKPKWISALLDKGFKLEELEI